MQQKELGQSKRRLFAGCGLFMASFLLLYMARNTDGFAQWYSVTIYPVLVTSIGRMSDLVLISIVEILLYITIIVLIVGFSRLGYKVFKKEKVQQEIIRFMEGLLLLGGVLFFIYTINCGINYQRNSFSECIGLEIEEYTVDELKKVCVILTEDINQISGEVARDEKGLMVMKKESNKFLLDGRIAIDAMERVSKDYEELAGYYPQPKGLMCSWILSVQKISGIYSPFTIEANYNREMVDYNVPFAMCHELSHLRGFMQEQEANFIAYLACTASDNTEFQYSGSMLGWIHCMNTLYEADIDAWKEVRSMLNEEALVDLRANSEFWAKYDGKTAEVADMINDSYLKANGQSDGVKSYDKMVDLLMAYYK